MVNAEDLARAAIDGNALLLRSMSQDWLAATNDFSVVAPPTSIDPTVRAVAAGLVELFAIRQHQAPPAWTAGVPAAPNPVYLLRESKTMVRLRTLCENESPLPLRRRRLFAPPNYLSFA